MDDVAYLLRCTPVHTEFLKIFFKTQSKGIPCEESDKLYARSCLFLYSFNCKCGFCDHVIFCLFKRINAAGLERCSVIPLLSLPRKFDQFFGAIHCQKIQLMTLKLSLYVTKFSTIFFYIYIYDETLLHIELCNSVISHIQRNPPKFF